MSEIPRASGFDNSLALLSEGYEFISRRCDRLDSNLFRTRLMLRPFICMRGEEMARLFYDEERFIRKGAAPSRVKQTLFGKGAVQGLDGAAHRDRKKMLMSLMSPDRIAELLKLTDEQWQRAIAEWQSRERVVLLEEMQVLLCRAVCAWTGVPLPEAEARGRAADLTAMIESPAAFGPHHWAGRRARNRSEKWIGSLVDEVRGSRRTIEPARALHVVAMHRDLRGVHLSRSVAAAELLNILRPAVAVSRYVAFAALALHQNPEFRERISTTPEDVSECFVQEVRRLSPFFPFATARVRSDFEWSGLRFKRGTRVLLDLFGTNRHEQAWEQADSFSPERFRNWSRSPWNFIPQGGGDHHLHHRCAGEWITIEIMKTAVGHLARLSYEVPEQDLTVSLKEMPAKPGDGFVIRNVKVGTDR